MCACACVCIGEYLHDPQQVTQRCDTADFGIGDDHVAEELSMEEVFGLRTVPLPEYISSPCAEPAGVVALC